MSANKKTALLALALLVPVPSLGVLSGMILFPDTTLGSTLFFLAKIWILVLPAFWHLVINRQRWSLSPLSRGGLWTGFFIGLVISGIILAAYLILGEHLIDPGQIKQKMTDEDYRPLSFIWV